VSSWRTPDEQIATVPDTEILATAMIDVDSEGRVTLADAGARARWLSAASREKTKPEPLPNTNCDGCNTVKGCGPINMVAGCSGKRRE
jgi:hypothetical protein